MNFDTTSATARGQKAKAKLSGPTLWRTIASDFECRSRLRSETQPRRRAGASLGGPDHEPRARRPLTRTNLSSCRTVEEGDAGAFAEGQLEVATTGITYQHLADERGLRSAILQLADLRLPIGLGRGELVAQRLAAR